MSKKTIPFSEQVLVQWVEEFGTPFYVYDENGIREYAARLYEAFDWVEELTGHKMRNYFAVKALPNPKILEILRDLGMGADCSSGIELELSLQAGLSGEDMVFTSNNTDPSEYAEALATGTMINLDDINQIDVLAGQGDFPDFVSFRFTPGEAKSSGTNTIIGDPAEAKFGVPDYQLIDAFAKARQLGATRFGIHSMMASNELGVDDHIVTAELVFEQAVRLKEELDIEVEVVNLGGGLGVPYHPEDTETNLAEFAGSIKSAYESILLKADLKPKLIYEFGRIITGPHGYLISKVRSTKDTYHRFVGLDASMANLMRPAMYDSYHHISILGSDGRRTLKQRVTGSLCEDNDYFTGNKTKDRDLPEMMVGDIVVIHDAGAHAHAMGFNYNGKLRSAEYLYRSTGEIELIRRAETRADLLSTLDY